MGSAIKKIRKIIKSRDFWLVLFVLIYGFYSGLFGDLFYLRSGTGQVFKSAKSARIEIDYGREKRAFEGDIFSDMSILDALLAASRGGGFEVRYALLDDSTDIIWINGSPEDGLNAKKWHFYLNGKEIETAKIHKTKINPGDKISAKFEPSNK